MENPTEFFRKTLNEFKAADVLFSKQLKLAEVTASAQQIETTNQAGQAERAVTGYLHAIEGKDSALADFPDAKISPQIDANISTLKNLAISVSKSKNELNQTNRRIETLKGEFQEALLQEEQEQRALERERREALLNEKANRRKRNIRRAIIAGTAICVAIAWHFWLLNRTTLSFTISVDGKSPSTDRMPKVTLDGKPFANGDKIKLGRHHLSVELQDFKPIERDFWAFYGANNLGALSLEFSKGGVSLLSDPPDTEFELSGNGRHWQGELPIHIDDVPVGTYQLIIRRKDWKLNRDVTVSRGNITTNRVEFQYGSIEVTSDPTRLAVSTNGVEIGKTPMILQEVIPGQYRLTASDGENDLTADIGVAPREAAKHAFVFHYGTVQLSSTPAGATVIRKGKEIGKTPLTLKHVPVESAPVELRLDGYASTNFMSLVREGMITNYAVKLFSEQYLAAMEKAQRALEANEFEQARRSVAIAIESDPADSKATALLTEINKELDKWKRQELITEQLAAEVNAKLKADELAAIPMLKPEDVIKNCWNKSDPYFSKLNAVDAAHGNAAAVPVAAATDVVVKSIEVVAWPFHKAKKKTRFNETQFFDSYFDHSYRYYGYITNVDMNDKTITFTSIGAAKQSYVVLARFGDASSLTAMQPGKPIWVSGKLKTLEEMDASFSYANRLVLADSTVYPSNTLPTNK